jgi:selenide,water dikinase
MSRGSNRRLTVQLRGVPRLPDAERLIEEGYVTGASGRNWKSYGESVSSDELFRDADRHLLTDPQTSGGLLIACDPAKSSNLVKTLIDAGYHASAVIGSVEDGPPQVLVRS